MSKIHMTLHNVVPSVARIGLLLIAAIVIISEVAPPVGAINNYGPDGNDFSAYDRVYIVVSQGGGSLLDAPYSKVYAYAPVGGGGDQTVQLNLLGADHCFDGKGSSAIDSSNLAAYGEGGNDTTFTVTTSRGVVTYNNTIRRVADATSVAGCNTEQVSLSIPVSNADRPSVQSGLNGYYRIPVEATIRNNAGVNAFKIILPGGGIVSFTNSSGEKFALQQRVDRGWLRSDFNVYFATPCDAANSVTAQLRWYDADQGQFGQSPATFGYKLYQRTRGTNNPWSEIPAMSNTNVGGDSEPRDASWDFQRDQEYRWEWYGVSPNNGIQFQVPFDSAYAAVACEGTDFNLDPHISLSSSYITPGMGSIGVSSNVHNSGTTASFSNEEWRITRYTVNPSSGQVQVWNGNRTFPANSVTTLTSGWLDGIDQNLAPGTRVCYVLSVEKGSSLDPTWKSSAPACATVVYTPFAYVLGNDLRVGSQFMSSTPNRPSGVQGYVTTRGGSWVEYGLLAPNAINGFASQSGARVGVTPDPSNSQSWSELTFANTGLSGCAYIQKGCFSNADVLGTIPRVENVLTTTTAGVTRTNITGSVNATAVAPGICGTVTASRIIYITGSLRIDCDIRQPTSGIGSAADIHQLVLVATGDITIVSSVAQIDAWVVSKGKLDTCDGVAMTSLRDNVCNTQLRINGPVMARTLELKRTYTDPTRNRAAEELNLRGDAYIWAHTVSRNNATWQTTYTTDLPPRY